MDKHNLNPNSKAKKRLRKLGPIILILGVVISAIGISSAFGGGPGVGLPFIGFPMIFVGAVMSMLGYMGDVSRYTASQTAPVAKDVTNYILENTKESIGGVAKEIGKGLRAETEKRCVFCGEELQKNAKFCDNCGKATGKTCSSCNALNDADAKFCMNCGKQI